MYSFFLIYKRILHIPFTLCIIPLYTSLSLPFVAAPLICLRCLKRPTPTWICIYYVGAAGNCARTFCISKMAIMCLYIFSFHLPLATMDVGGRWVAIAAPIASLFSDAIMVCVASTLDWRVCRTHDNGCTCSG